MKLLLASLGSAAVLAVGVSAQPVLFSDDFEADSSASWIVLEMSENGIPDYTAEFSFDYSQQDVTVNGVTAKIPAAPNSAAGATRGVKLTINNNDDVAARAAVSLFAKDQSFAGNFALRADMWMNYNGGSYGGEGSTEFGTVGINHTGTVPCGVLNDTLPDVVTGDGLWFRTSGEGGAARDFRRYEADYGLADGLIGTDHGQAVFQDRFPGPDYESPGAVGKHWVQVEVAQRDNHVMWKINGFVIAEFDNLSASASGTVMIGTLDAFASIANPKADNFVIFDNVRVVNLDLEPALSTVRVETVDPDAGEPANSGTFTIARDGGDQTQPLEVTYRVSGTATPGDDYATNGLMAMKVTIPANASSVDLVVQPVNDLAGEPTETVVVTLTGNTAYEMHDLVSASLDLVDDGDTTGVSLAATDPYAYERMADDTLTFEVKREGDTSTDLIVDLNYGGTAGPEDCDGALRSVTIPAGYESALLVLTPKDDVLVEGNETVEVNLAAGPDYTVNPDHASIQGTLYDDDHEAKPVLFTETFDTDTSADWIRRFGAGNNIEDYLAEFAYDYSLDGIDPAPHGNGTSKGLKLTVNKDATASTAGLNLYAKDRTFAGGYALRFDMFLTFNSAVAGTTEHATFGINHTGTFTNRHAAAGGDGLWFAVETDGSASGGRSYTSYLGDPAAAPTYEAKAATTFAPHFPTPPYMAAGAPSGRWVDVEVIQSNGVVTWKINGVTLFERAGVQGPTTGTVMLGYMDTYSSIGDPGNYVIFDNVTVVQLQEPPPPQPQILGIQIVGPSVQIAFTSPSGDPADFQIVGATTVADAFQPEANAAVQRTGEGQFQATVPLGSDPMRYYRVRR